MTEELRGIFPISPPPGGALQGGGPVFEWRLSINGTVSICGSELGPTSLRHRGSKSAENAGLFWAKNGRFLFLFPVSSLPRRVRLEWYAFERDLKASFRLDKCPRGARGCKRDGVLNKPFV